MTRTGGARPSRSRTSRRGKSPAARSPSSTRVAKDGGAILLDTRRALKGAPKRAKLAGWKAGVFLACDCAQPFSVLEALPAVQEAGVDAAGLVTFLRHCEKHMFTIGNGPTWLNVAVHTPERAATHDDAQPGRRAPIRDRTARTPLTGASVGASP
jgi:hypothetical protein